MSRCKADPASAGPGSSDMEEQGRGGERGQRPSRLPIKHDVGVVQMAKIMRGEEGNAVNEICVGGCIRPSKVCWMMTCPASMKCVGSVDHEGPAPKVSVAMYQSLY